MKDSPAFLAIVNYMYRHKGRPPSYRQIVEMTDLKSTSMVDAEINRLERASLVRRVEEGASRNIEVIGSHWLYEGNTDTTPIIFLDVDGPLICLASLIEGKGSRTPLPTNISTLNWLTDQTGAEIVVSSTWRKAGLTHICTIFEGWGITAPIAGLTPVLRGKTRGEEIDAYLQDRETGHPPFIIIDDDDDMGHLSNHLVLVSYHTGLTWRDAHMALGMMRVQGVRIENGSLEVRDYYAKEKMEAE